MILEVRDSRIKICITNDLCMNFERTEDLKTIWTKVSEKINLMGSEQKEIAIENVMNTGINKFINFFLN